MKLQLLSKSGKFYNRIIVLIAVAALLLYAGYMALNYFRDPLSTILAVEVSVSEGRSVEGWVVREEQLLTSSSAITVPERSEGEKVGAGQVVAMGYSDADAQTRQDQIELLSAQLEQLTYATTVAAEAGDTTSLDDAVFQQLTAWAKLTASQSLSESVDVSTALKGLILRHGADDGALTALNSQIAQIQSQLTSLETQAVGDTTSINAPVAGYFSADVDGYEQVLTPELLSTMSIAQLESLEPTAISSNAFGRLITSSRWYYVAAVPTENLKELDVNDTATVQFAISGSESLPMQVERLGDDENGQSLLVLSSESSLQSVTLLRRQQADIILRSHHGLRVPKEAIRTDEAGNTGVYILETTSAQWKPVTLLYDDGDSYVVALDKSATDNLWPGDEIIVNAKELYDGKVVITS
ncbi:MAG TPA: hypothetical protein IAA83_02910 [Candidatus Avoscillospira avistercoris]|uniref:Membrane fusion protein n=1 Tax=Candidatus Avoscillospira avistercoris TaxID=2840707 RepID=A0A9D1F9N2_9FIRM|nr:hypothetical protein [Candidatus Avoscillospira avistercoris]